MVLQNEDCKQSLPTPDDDPTKVLAESVLKLSSLIEEQIVLLRRREKRRDLSDKSRQPIPEVTSTSSSAWNALLRSTLADAIQPKVDGWRSGLDALLVFLGLFSAIVTAFIVQSLTALKQDEVARTNELLSNITNILIAVSGVPVDNLNLTHPAVFFPAENDVRLNVYLTLSLVLSLAIAAIAIACRGFLNLVAWSRFSKAVQRLTDIRNRWKAAERLLGPTVESLPQLLIIPVLLFLVGLLDSLFSTTLQLSSPPTPILVASGISLLLVTAVAAGLSFTIIDGSLRPTTSPFQSRLAHALNVSFVELIRPAFIRMRNASLSPVRTTQPTQKIHGLVNPSSILTQASMDIYHEVLQATGDDSILDDASAALLQIIGQRVIHRAIPRRLFKRLPVDILPQECATLLHLLSPEASMRSNRTAAEVIVKMAFSGRGPPLRYSQNDLGRLLPSLARAARRSAFGDSLVALWDSEFLRAMGIVGQPVPYIPSYAPAITVLSAPHWSWNYLAGVELSGIFFLIFDVIDAKITEELGKGAGDPAENQASIVDSVFSAIGQPIPKPTPSHRRRSLNSSDVLASLLYLPDEVYHLQDLIISWLLRTQTPARVLAGAQNRLDLIQRPEWLHRLAPREFENVPRLVAALAQFVLALPEVTSAERIPLASLCVRCLLYTPNIRSRAPAGFVFRARLVLNSLLAAVEDTDLILPEWANLLGELMEIKTYIQEDLLWKEGKDKVLREYERICSFIRSHAGKDDAVTSLVTNRPHKDLVVGTVRPISPDAVKYEAAEEGLFREIDIENEI